MRLIPHLATKHLGLADARLDLAKGQNHQEHVKSLCSTGSVCVICTISDLSKMAGLCSDFHQSIIQKASQFI